MDIPMYCSYCIVSFIFNIRNMISHTVCTLRIISPTLPTQELTLPAPGKGLGKDGKGKFGKDGGMYAEERRKGIEVEGPCIVCLKAQNELPSFLPTMCTVCDLEEHLDTTHKFCGFCGKDEFFYGEGNNIIL
jgi:hypothetical protein